MRNRLPIGCGHEHNRPKPQPIVNMQIDPQAVPCTINKLLTAQLTSQVRSDPALSDEASAYAVHVSVGETLGWCKDGVPRYWKSGGIRRDEPVTRAPLSKSGLPMRSADLGA